MKVTMLLAVAIPAIVLPAVCRSADRPVLYSLSYRGTTSFIDSNGKIVSKQVTEKTFLQDAAAAGGVTDLKTLAIVYHIGGDDLGDTIDVVSSATGQPLRTLFGLYFGEAFGRTAITNGTGMLVKRLDYVYTEANNHSLGSALVNEAKITDKKGNTSASIQGQMQYIVPPVNGNQAQVCSGRFSTLKPFVPKGGS